MTELDRERIVGQMFPDWREHLNDGRVLDNILEGLTCREIVLNKCSRPGCNNVQRTARKTCMRCAAKAAEYMRTYQRRKATNANKLRSVADTDSDQKARGRVTTQFGM